MPIQSIQTPPCGMQAWVVFHGRCYRCSAWRYVEVEMQNMQIFLPLLRLQRSAGQGGGGSIKRHDWGIDRGVKHGEG